MQQTAIHIHDGNKFGPIIVYKKYSTVSDSDYKTIKNGNIRMSYVTKKPTVKRFLAPFVHFDVLKSENTTSVLLWATQLLYKSYGKPLEYRYK